MKKSLWLTVCVMGLAAVYGSPAQAAYLDEVIVESRSGGQNFSAYVESPGGFPNSWANSSAKSTAEGVTPGIGSRFNTTASFGAWFEVSPTLPEAGAMYEVYVTITTATTPFWESETGIEVTGGSGLPETTDAFSPEMSGDQWALVGTLTLDAGVDKPTVRFVEISHGNRFYADAIKFVQVPEPATLTLLAAGGLLLRRRRQTA